jgi:hypothetical protein
MLPAGPWMLVGGGGMSFTTTLIRSVSMLVQRFRLEHHSPGWVSHILLEEAREERRECRG